MFTVRIAPRIASLLLLGLVAGCDLATDPAPVPTIQVTDLTLEAVGDAAPLEAVIAGSEESPAWESLDPSIVAVSSDGRATAIASGTATVRARIGEVTGEGTVTVLPPVRIDLSELVVVTDPTGIQGLGMRVRNTGGRGYYRLEFWRFTPDGRHERALYYDSDAEAPVGLDIEYRNFLLDEPADWVIAFVREPYAQALTRTSCVWLGDGPACPSDLPEPLAPVDSVRVAPGGAVLEIGQAIQYAARVFAGGIEVDRPVSWHTITPDIVALDSTGLATALAAGYGQVEATAEGVTGAVGLTVATPEPEPVGSVSIVTPSDYPIRLWTGQAWGLQARVYGTYGQLLDDRTVTWAVQDTSVATVVDSTGWLVAVGPGTTTVSATAGGKTGYAAVRAFVHPVDSARFRFHSTLSDTSGYMIAPSVDTTWTDSLGVTQPAFITFDDGHLHLDWSGSPTAYDQRLVMRTFIYQDSVQLVAETEYVDSGTVGVTYDWFTGRHIYDLTSTLTPGLAYRARYSLPGELAVLQPVGSIPARKFYFDLEP